MTTMVAQKVKCRACDGDMSLLVDLGRLPASTIYTAEPTPDADMTPVRIFGCSCGYVGLGDLVDPRVLYCGDSHEFTGVRMSGYLKEYAAWVMEGYRRNGRILDIGSNDGTFLTNFKEGGWNILGVDPAIEPGRLARSRGIPTETCFFDHNFVEKYLSKYPKPDIITANRVWANMADLDQATECVNRLLAPDGYFIIETGYLLPILENMLVETIYPEHISYDTLFGMRAFFERYGMYVVDAEESPVKGGSLRVVVRFVPNMMTRSMVDILNRESIWLQSNPWDRFKDRLDAERERIASNMEIGFGRAYGYGAGMPGMALTFYLGLQDRLLATIDEDSTLWGKFMPGTGIPIVGPTAIMEADRCVLLAHRYAQSIMAKHRGFNRWLIPFQS